MPFPPNSSRPQPHFWNEITSLILCVHAFHLFSRSLSIFTHSLPTTDTLTCAFKTFENKDF